MRYRIKPLFFAATLLISLFLMETINIEAADPGWITTVKGCKVWNSNPQPNESATWSGECFDGKAHGNGILIWYKNGIESSREILSTKSGSFMEKGVISAKVDASSISFLLGQCDNITSYREITVFVEGKIDLSLNSIANSILEKAAQFAIEKCPKRKKFDNIAVEIYQGGNFKDFEYLYKKYNTPSPSNSNQIKYFDELNEKNVVNARNYDDNKLTWREYDNKALQKRIFEQKTKYDTKVKALQEEKTRRKMAAHKAEEKRKKQEIRKRYNRFVRKNNVKEWPSIDALSANPFVYEGKTVGIILTFSKMLTATKGIFEEEIVVSKIPKRTFTKRTRVILAGRVLGNTAVKTALGGEVLLPYLKFVGVHFCKDWTCSDLIVK